MPADLPALIHRVRTHPGVLAKAEIGLVSDVFGDSDWVAGPGDDGAVVPVAGTSLVVGGEAILPSFVAADPHGAGVAAVTTNLNDLAAMGAWPLALVDTVTGPRPVIEPVLEGMRWAARLYPVPVVGGHLTVTAGPPGLSAFGLGRSDRPLAARAAEPGQSLVVGCCVEGRMRTDSPFCPSFDERGEQLAGDVRLLAQGAASGWVAAAKDVSMAGLVGSVALLLECQPLGGALGPGARAGPGRGEPGAVSVLLPVLRVPALRSAGPRGTVPARLRRTRPGRGGGRRPGRHRPAPAPAVGPTGDRVRPRHRVDHQSSLSRTGRGSSYEENVISIR